MPPPQPTSACKRGSGGRPLFVRRTGRVEGGRGRSPPGAEGHECRGQRGGRPRSGPFRRSGASESVDSGVGEKLISFLSLLRSQIRCFDGGSFLLITPLSTEGRLRRRSLENTSNTSICQQEPLPSLRFWKSSVEVVGLQCADAADSQRGDAAMGKFTTAHLFSHEALSFYGGG